jgi:hypothetical protein
MNREIHVRFCEGLRVRFPWATHLRLCQNRKTSAGENGGKTAEQTAAGCRLFVP